MAASTAARARYARLTVAEDAYSMRFSERESFKPSDLEECRLRWPSVIFLTRLIPKTLALSSNRQYCQAKPTRPAVARPLDSLERSLRF